MLHLFQMNSTWTRNAQNSNGERKASQIIVTKQKNNAEVTTDFDYGEANDLSDGLHHIDLPPVHTRNNKSSHRVYANNPHLLPGNQQFAAPSEGSFGFSVSSDCL